MKPVRFILPAEQEMLGAARYYALQAPGLGDDFLDKIDSAVRDIAEHPDSDLIKLDAVSLDTNRKFRCIYSNMEHEDSICLVLRKD